MKRKAVFQNRRKYNSKSTKCLQGHYHPSMLEAKYCNELQAKKELGEIVDYTTQYKIDYMINGKKICSHYVDFWVEVEKNVFEAHETKGFETPLWRLKHKLFLALFPNIAYVVIK